MKQYYYISGVMGLTSSMTFSRDKNRWITFSQAEVNSIGLDRPYGVTKTGIFILVEKYW